MRYFGRICLLCAVLWPCAGLLAGTTVDDLKREVEDLRKHLNESKTSSPSTPIRRVDAAVAGKYGPSTDVTTRAGKLEIGGLLQIWNYSIAEDHVDVFGHRENTAGFAGTNETRDNKSYRIRRAEIKFTMDIHENVTAVVMIDPAREATSFTPLPSNQGLFKSKAFVAPEYAAANDAAGDTMAVSNVQTGAGAVPNLLQDAYINYHGVVPHHDFTIGQFKPKIGEEGTRNSAYLDFAERAMVTQTNDFRDLGVQAHGSWWDERLQYWVGAFDGAGDYFLTSGQFQNRSDDNDEKDFVGSVMVRPMWNHGCWGSLEFGYSGEWGRHGESATATPFDAPLNGLNRKETAAIRQAAWGMYKPMGPVRGLWLRGEWGYQKDRARPLSVDAYELGSGDGGEQAAPNPFIRQGWFGSVGYKLTDSVFADRLSKGGFWNRLMEPVEFAFRYETFQNIVTEDLVQPDTHTDLTRTNVFTAGVNYYVKAYNTRVQVNYMVVDEQQGAKGNDIRSLREVRNNVFIFTYQIAF